MTYDKSGRLLNLTNAHGVICKKKHGVTCPHDPRTDVIYTKCIFDYIVQNYKYENLIKHFS